MIYQALAGAALGLGLFLLVRAVFPGRPGAAATVAQIDALRSRGQYMAASVPDGQGERGSRLRAAIGPRVAEFYARMGWQQRSLRADLAILDRGWEGFLATKVLLSVSGLLFGPLIASGLWLTGLSRSLLVPVWLSLACMALFFFLPDLEIRNNAQEKRKDFRRVVGAYLDLVAMNLAGGRGLPEALMAAAELSDGWALRRIRDALTDARLTGVSQWVALGRLGDRLNVDELKDLSAALGLVADDGAKVRQSLAARAETMRHREMAEIEGQAGAQSQSMLVAQLLLCAAFLIFLTFPAVMRVLQW
ncbi:type II secretion system F family protein [Kitasatospora sp. KL5]|uniref:type II secretion system F family protein n=1 Tax=Kitasatospora sp. KL5 TaxID=3425125 RepID=UPI003D6E2D68